MARTTILDCTLRDGGYYNDWDFDPELARELISGLNAAGVDIIELGYRSRVEEGFYGLFRFCNEELITSLLPARSSAKYAFMIDTKEFLNRAGKCDSAALQAAVPRAEASLFSWARVATHPSTIEEAAKQVAQLKELGYSVALNIMGFSTLADDAVGGLLRKLRGLSVDALYLADSYGSLTPESTLAKIDAIRTEYAGAIGVHMHENSGLALANTTAAIEHGVEFADATVAGMGRGAGNLRLEQLLLFLYFRRERTDLSPSALLPVLKRHLLPMQARYGWGWDFTYMLSGLVGIHPTYCQELRTGARYDIEDVARILEEIPAGKRAKYDEKELLAAESRRAQHLRGAPEELAVERGYVPAEVDQVLVVAGGPQVKRHARALRQYIARHQPKVFECNETGVLHGIARETVVMNSVRLHELAEGSEGNDAARRILTALPAVPSTLDRCERASVQYRLGAGAFEASDSELVVPSYVVGMLAVALALRSKPKRIVVAGFDGFTDPERRAEQAEMETFWALARQSAAAKGVEFSSLLPTTYSLPVHGLYGFL